MNDRQNRIISCMNAAVNLYGLVSFDELIELYNRYSADKPEPLNAALSAAEIDGILELPPPDDFDLESPERWFEAAEVDGSRYLVAEYGFCIHAEWDEHPLVDENAVRKHLADCTGLEMKFLDEDGFFLYDEPKAFEDSAAAKKFVKFLRKEYDYDKMDAEFAVWDVQEELRFCPSMRTALISARNTLGLMIYDREEFEDLVDILLPLVRNTRAWDYRGHTETELVKSGVRKDFREIDGEEVFDWFMEDHAEDDDEDPDKYENRDWQPDAWDTGELSDDDLEEILPPAKLVGPLDFKKVKDADWRERILADYDNVRSVTVDFVKSVLMKELTQKERKAASARLGFDTGKEAVLAIANRDMIAGDFASMMDDQFGEPAIKRVLKRFDKLTKYEQLGARYYRNYRYAWLVVDAVKAGFGMKCRDLLSGEELFLMEKSMSQSPDARGMTLCCGIAPIGEVYCSLGVISHANFEPSAAVHRIVRQHLGLPLDGPLELSLGDQARFAAEAIRRINALGHYGDVVYG